MRLLEQIGRLALGELRLEAQRQDALWAATFFGLVTVVLFALGIYDPSASPKALPALLWTALVLAGVTIIQRAFEAEREGACLQALALIPGAATPFFVAKVLAHFVTLSATMVLVTPLAWLLLAPDWPLPWLLVGATLGLGALAFAILGTLVGAMLEQLRQRALLLPLVLFPLMLPIVAIGVTITVEGQQQAGLTHVQVHIPAPPPAQVALGIGTAPTLTWPVDPQEPAAEQVARAFSHLAQHSAAPDLLVWQDGRQGVRLTAPRPLALVAHGMVLEEIPRDDRALWRQVALLGLLTLIALPLCLWLFRRLLDPL